MKLQGLHWTVGPAICTWEELQVIKEILMILILHFCKIFLLSGTAVASFKFLIICDLKHRFVIWPPSVLRSFEKTKQFQCILWIMHFLILYTAVVLTIADPLITTCFLIFFFFLFTCRQWIWASRMVRLPQERQ